MKYVGLAVLVLLIAGGLWFFNGNQPVRTSVTTFEECAAAGYPVGESYPRQCWDDNGNHFVENSEVPWDVSYVNASPDLIRNVSVEAGDSIASPITITGEARGYWFFEASFPVVVVDWDGRIIAETHATAGSEWMTEEFVPFSATVEFKKPPYGERGAIIVRRDNPSGLPENDAALEIPIRFQ